jgi:molybdopterin molybdotransferase
MLTLTGRVLMGESAGGAVAKGACIYVPTGGILPDGADAMVMVEDCEVIGDEVLVQRAVAPGENVVMRGEDFGAGDVVLGRGRRCSPRDLGVLASVGCESVVVAKRPVVGIISTGNELVEVSEEPGQGQVRDANTYLCSGFVTVRGGTARCYGIVRDERPALEKAVRTAAEESDLVLISGGSSKDERDICAATIADLGEVLVHGIAIAPGKPTIIGRAGAKPVIGLPGHPASAYVVLIAIVGELIDAMLGSHTPQRTVQAILTESIPSAKGRRDYVRVALKNGKATPLFGKSGLLNTLVQSSGLVEVPAGSEGIETGAMVDVILW